jgi:hypothetical protein
MRELFQTVKLYPTEARLSTVVALILITISSSLCAGLTLLVAANEPLPSSRPSSSDNNNVAVEMDFETLLDQRQVFVENNDVTGALSAYNNGKTALWVVASVSSRTKSVTSRSLQFFIADGPEAVDINRRLEIGEPISRDEMLLLAEAIESRVSLMRLIQPENEKLVEIPLLNLKSDKYNELRCYLFRDWDKHRFMILEKVMGGIHELEPRTLYEPHEKRSSSTVPSSR